MMSVRIVRRGVRSFGLFLAAIAFAAVLAVPIVSIVHTLQHPKPVRATVPPVSAVVWGDRVFSTPRRLNGWLEARGVAYSVWANRHPPASRLLGRQAERPVAGK